jgi:hypothetical protein
MRVSKVCGSVLIAKAIIATAAGSQAGVPSASVRRYGDDRVLRPGGRGPGLASDLMSTWRATARPCFATPASSTSNALSRSGGLRLAFRPLARLAQDEERRCASSEARRRGRLGQTEMPMIEAGQDLILKRVSASRPSGQWNDDDFVVLAESAVVGRIFKANAAPVGSPWRWTMLV